MRQSVSAVSLATTTTMSHCSSSASLAEDSAEANGKTDQVMLLGSYLSFAGSTLFSSYTQNKVGWLPNICQAGQPVVLERDDQRMR